ncbi:MAG TPA: M56 family metallopeptidase, partial [Pricia sp.]|nr:M56 family metallopeptidase [Pricia sp.]
MVLFILKSSACLAIFLMFYKLLLEKERMHIFKRYYLLAALVLALLIPSITFTDYVEVTPLPERYGVSETVPQRQHQIVNPAAVDSPTPIEASSAFDRAFTFWAIYIFGMLFSLLGFLKNLLKIARTVQDNPKLRIGALVNVLLQNCSVPHTFLNYVFLDKKKFETNAIPKEVLIHESTHAKQKHSLDVLFVELLQIVLWFNPLIYLIKKSIKLNHEFLADQAVLEHGTHIPQYQYLLLNFASSANCSTHQPSLANAFDYPVYSSIRLTLFGKTFTLGRNAVGQVKKRFSVMKKRTSKKSILARSILLLPLLAILLYSFTETEIIRKETDPNNGTHSDSPLPKTEKFGSNLILDSESNPQEGASMHEVIKYNSLAKKYNALPKEERIIPSGDLKSLETVFRKMSKAQKDNAQPFPECPDPKSDEQEGATEKQMAEYNALAKKYNTMLSANGGIRIKKSDIDRMEYLHGLMTEAQHTEAEPFPDFPEPPEPPTPPSPPDKSDKEFPEQVIEEIIETQDPYDGKVIYIDRDIDMEEEIEKQRALMEKQEVEMRRQADRIKIQGEKRKKQQVEMQE